MLAIYCKKGELEKTVEIMDMMDKANMYINETAFNHITQCHIICGYVLQCPLHELKCCSKPKNSISFNFTFHRNIDAANDVIASLKEAGYKVNMFTFEAFLMHYAKDGDLESIEKTFDRMKEENLEVLSRDIFKLICEMAINGHAEKIDALLPYVKPTIELRRSLLSGITILVEKSQSTIIPKILERSDGNVKERLKHLIDEMVRCSTPEVEFVETIANIEATGITIEANFDIFKSALDGPSADIIRRILKYMQAKSIPVTENVFENLIQLAAKEDINEVLNVVDCMCNEFKIAPQLTFVRDVILPALNSKENPALAYAKLEASPIRKRTITLAIVAHSLSNKDIKMAYEFASKNLRTFYSMNLIRRPLLDAFMATHDVKHFVSLARVIHDSYSGVNSYQKLDQEGQKPYTDSEIKTKQKTFTDDLLWSAILSRHTDTEIIVRLLESFVDEGLAISTEQAQKIQAHLKVESDSQIGRLLHKLSTESLPLRPIEVKRRAPSDLNKLSSIEIQNILEVKQAQGHSAAATEKQLFMAYIREGNTAEIESILVKNKIALSNSDYAQLIELYTRNGNLDNALMVLKRVCAKNASFKLDSIKVARLVRLMIDKERDFEEVDALLLSHRQGKAEYRIFIFEHLLDALAENGCYKLTEKLFDTLIKYSYIEPTPQSTGPLVRAYLKGSKFNEAVDKYEHLASTFKLTPMTMILFVQLIKNNQIELLQRAFDLVEQIHGEQNAMCRLAFAFIECGRVQQARAILENDRLRNISTAIGRECKTYVQYDRIDAAKNLLKATAGLFCDRHIMYQTLLDIYKKKNNATDALELWYEYSIEDGILPKPAFKAGLVALLKANNKEIPSDLAYVSEKLKPSDKSIEKQTVTN